MSEIIFNDKNNIPDDNLLAEQIGDAFEYWGKVKKCVEGRGIAIEVRDGKYLSDINMLIDIKINN